MKFDDHQHEYYSMDFQSDFQIEQVIETLQYEIYPSSSLRPKIISYVKKVAYKRVLDQKFGGFTITLLLLFSIQLNLNNASLRWREATFFMPLKQLKMHIRTQTQNKAEATNWSTHDFFWQWRKKQGDQFARVIQPGIQPKLINSR